MEDRGAYEELHDYLLGADLEIALDDFRGCFPKKYQKSPEIARLFQEVKREQKRARQAVVANLKREFAPAKGSREDEELKETIAVLEGAERELKQEYKHVVEELADLQEDLHAYEDKLNNLAEHDRPLKKAKLDLPLLTELNEQLSSAETD
jgi:chromosome segregation ATPase